MSRMAASIQGTKAHLLPTGTRRCVSLGLLLYITLNAACFVAQPAQLAFRPATTLSSYRSAGRFTAGYSAPVLPSTISAH